MTENELILFDRVEVIKAAMKKYGEENFVISFSGGKDSTVLHYLIDLALPDNKIPRVFINTGIEYSHIVNYVYDLAKQDDRFITIKPKYPLGRILKEYGYPFKSKEHSQLVQMYQRNGGNPSTERYYNPPETRRRFGCPKCLRYQFEGPMDFKISAECCNKLKKEPFADWQTENSVPYRMTGERVAEGGLRASHGGCLVVDKSKHLKKFKPLNPVSDEWIDWFIQEHGIKLCDLYYEPYNFTRTGCMGCPYNIHIQESLETMRVLLPDEYRKATTLWKPVYDEYKRIGYRIKEK